jgi:hypothetical protein
LRPVPTIFAALFILAPAGAAAATPALACEPEGALTTTITDIAPDGVIRIGEGLTIRLANLVWPDHLEEGRRRQVVALITRALAGQAISWKPAAGPDRWGITPAHLFVRESAVDAPPPFWLQAGLVESGELPAWPEPAGTDCWKRLGDHETVAISARRGHWAPRAQAARHREIEAAREKHAGRRIVALWRVKSVRPWRSMHFVNIVPSFRGGPSIGLTRRQVSALTDTGRNPSDWGGKWIVARFIAGPHGLSRIRVEAIEPLADPRATKSRQPVSTGPAP